MNPKLLAPLLIMGLTAVGAFIIVATAPSVEHVEPERAIPTVRVIDATTQTVRHAVRTQGTVAPRTETDLVPEVSGRVVWISPSLATGGFFEDGEPLLRIEKRDYELTRQRQAAAVTRARSEQRFAASELERQEGLARGGVSSPSQLSDARRAASVAEANLLDARAALEQAERDLERTEIRAPFDGRVRDEQVDVGQFVSRGTAIARIYATDFAEIRLPIADEQLAFLDLHNPTLPGRSAEEAGPVVKLSAWFAGQRSEWQGRIVRTEGEIDPRSRMVNVVARVEDPYRPTPDSGQVPLAVGLFVEAAIEGPEARDVIVVPRSAMRDASTILVVDAEDKLHSKQVKVLRIDRDEVIVQGPLGPGERICVSPLQVVVEGMDVRTVQDQSVPAAGTGRS